MIVLLVANSVEGNPSFNYSLRVFGHQAGVVSITGCSQFLQVLSYPFCCGYTHHHHHHHHAISIYAECLR